MVKFIVILYAFGAMAVVFELSERLNEKSDNTIGFRFSVLYILTSLQMYRYILLSWYFFIRI